MSDAVKKTAEKVVKANKAVKAVKGDKSEKKDKGDKKEAKSPRGSKSPRKGANETDVQEPEAAPLEPPAAEAPAAPAPPAPPAPQDDRLHLPPGFFSGTMGYSNNAMLGAMYAGAGFNSAGLAADSQGFFPQQPQDPFAYLHEGRPYASQMMSQARPGGSQAPTEYPMAYPQMPQELPGPNPVNAVCPVHNKGVTKYCESCRAACCIDCTTMGAHTGPGHMITSVDEVYMSRARSIRFALDSCIRKRQADLFQQIRRVEGRMTEVRQAKKTIERETMQDAQAIVDRLTCDEVQRLTALRQDVDSLRREMEEAHTLAQRTSAVCESVDPLTVISSHDDILQACQRMVERPIKTSIAVDDRGFPEETKMRNEMASKYDELEKLVGVKDTIIWALVEERDELRKDKEDAKAVMQATQAEMHHWVQLNEKYYSELRRFLSKCRFCEAILTPESVNEDCAVSDDCRHYFEQLEIDPGEEEDCYSDGARSRRSAASVAR